MQWDLVSLQGSMHSVFSSVFPSVRRVVVAKEQLLIIIVMTAAIFSKLFKSTLQEARVHLITFFLSFFVLLLKSDTS